MRAQKRWTAWSIAGLTVGLALLTLCTFSGPAQAAPPNLPPRPTMLPPSPGDAQKTAGALIVLQATFDERWATSGLAWQDLWTVVQWQDAAGVWHNVDGWQGTLDKVADGVGWKAWWLPEELAGKGPFRWVVYRSRGGSALVTSETFSLPSPSLSSPVIEVSIRP